MPRTWLAPLAEAWRAHFDQKAQRLGRHPLFDGLSRRQLAQAASFVDVLHLAAGRVLVRQDCHPAETFVVERGWAEVLLDGVPIARSGRDQTIGLAARAAQLPAGATVRSLTPMDVLVIDPQRSRSFTDLLPWSIEARWADGLPLAGAAEPSCAPTV
jgi:uncharacterized Zn-binding protein involved in type VI secretion